MQNDFRYIIYTACQSEITAEEVETMGNHNHCINTGIVVIGLPG